MIDLPKKSNSHFKQKIDNNVCKTHLAKPIPAKAMPTKRPLSVGVDQRLISGKIGDSELH